MFRIIPRDGMCICLPQRAWDNNGMADFHSPVGGAADEAQLQRALESMLQVWISAIASVFSSSDTNPPINYVTQSSFTAVTHNPRDLTMSNTKRDQCPC